MPQPEASLTLHAAAAGYGVPMVRLGRWCATGKLRCERHGDGWRIPNAEGATVAKLVLEDGSARAHVHALAVPVPKRRPTLR